MRRTLRLKGLYRFCTRSPHLTYYPVEYPYYLVEHPHYPVEYPCYPVGYPYYPVELHTACIVLCQNIMRGTPHCGTAPFPSPEDKPSSWFAPAHDKEPKGG